MTAEKLDDILTPHLEELAAYVDDELDEVRRSAIEAWLANHPELAAEVQQQRRLADIWQATPPAQPSEKQWGEILARVETAALPLPWPQPLWRRPGFSFTLAVLGTAAVLLFAFSLLRWHKAPHGYPNDDSRFRQGMPDRPELVQAQAEEQPRLIADHPPHSAGSDQTRPVGLRLPGRSLQIER
jgi:hypothetical protein